MKIKVWVVIEDNDNGLNSRVFADEGQANAYFADCMESYMGSDCHSCSGAMVTEDRKPCPTCDGVGRVDLSADELDMIERLREALKAKNYADVFEIRSDMSDDDYFRFDGLNFDESEIEVSAPVPLVTISGGVADYEASEVFVFDWDDYEVSNDAARVEMLKGIPAEHFEAVAKGLDGWPVGWEPEEDESEAEG